MSRDAFWATPPGQAALAWEQRICDNFCEGAFGYYALDLGLPGLHPLKLSTVQLQLLQGQNIVFNALEWPFQNDALDYIVLPHVLEFSPDPHGVLREAARCLRSGGVIALTAFNPRSALALSAKKAHLGDSKPWISRRRMVDWMRLLNLQPDRGAFGQWRPFREHPAGFERWAWLDKMGERWWPQMANIYALRAVKRVSPDLRRLNETKRSVFVRPALISKPALQSQAPSLDEHGKPKIL